MKEHIYRGFTITITKPHVRYIWKAEGVLESGEVATLKGYSFYTIGDAIDDAETEIRSLLEEYEPHRA